jgi:hypothetical protein
MRIEQDSSRRAKLPRLRRVKRIDPWRWGVELMAAMARRPDAHLCYAKKLATFGLQRDIVAADLPCLNELANVSQNHGSTQELMLHLIKDDAFRTPFGGSP